MYPHNIAEMALKVATSLGLDTAPEKVETIEKTLQDYWRNRVALPWSVDDVLSLDDSLSYS